jgi:hypothetical protein
MRHVKAIELLPRSTGGAKQVRNRAALKKRRPAGNSSLNERSHKVTRRSGKWFKVKGRI